MKRTWLFIAIAFLIVFLPSCGIAGENHTLTVMTYNVEFMWDGVAPEEGNVDFPWKGNQKAAEARMKKIAKVIKRSNPDIINLVEVENINALETLNSKFLEGAGYEPYLVKGRDTATGQDVALLTKIEPEAIQRNDIKGKSRNVVKAVAKNYFATIDYEGYKLGIVGIHFLAQPRSKSRQDLRQAQADAVRQTVINLQRQGYLPIVLGDFNDYDGEVLDRNNHQPITNVLAQIKSLGNNDPDDDLINTMEFVTKENRYTSYYDPNRDGEIQPDKEYAAIDFVLIAPELKSAVRKVTIDRSYDPRELSDHFPIIVTLDLG